MTSLQVRIVDEYPYHNPWGPQWSGLTSRLCPLSFPSSYTDFTAIFLKCTRSVMVSGPLQICCAIASLPLNLCVLLSLPSLRNQIKCSLERASLTSWSIDKIPEIASIISFCLIFLQNRYHFWFPSLECELQARRNFVIFCLLHYALPLLAHTSLFVNQKTGAPSRLRNLKKGCPSPPGPKQS